MARRVDRLSSDPNLETPTSSFDSLLQNSMIRSKAARYAAVGVVNTLFGYGLIFGSMYLLGFGTVQSNALGYGAGFVLSFYLNRRFTFRSAAPTGSALPLFALVMVAAYVANLGTVVLLTRVLGWNDYVAQVAGLPAYLGIGYGGSALLVFPHRESETY